MPLYQFDTDKSTSHLFVFWLSINQLPQITRKLSFSPCSKACIFVYLSLWKVPALRHAMQAMNSICVSPRVIQVENALLSLQSLQHPVASESGQGTWGGFCSERCLWSRPCSGDARLALFLSTAPPRVAVDESRQTQQKQKGKPSPGLCRRSSRSPVSELSRWETMFYTTYIGFESVETRCSFSHCNIMPYIAYARHKIQHNGYQIFTIPCQEKHFQ